MSPRVNFVVEGVWSPPATKLASGRVCLLMKPAQYKSEYVGVCTRSVGKLAEVGLVPCGAGASAGVWAHAAVASNNINSPVFFMLPPERALQASVSLVKCQKRKAQPESNNRVGVGQGYEGVANPGIETSNGKVFQVNC